MTKHKLGADRLAALENALAEDDESDLLDLDDEIGALLVEESRRLPRESIPGPRRLYHACRQLMLGVADGGVNQFMSDWGPEVVLDAVAFFEQRGLHDAAKRLRRAITALPGGILPETHSQLEAALTADGVEAAHEDIDDDLLDLELDEDLVRERLEFATEHPTEFFA
jgi:hypothetical protein